MAVGRVESSHFPYIPITVETGTLTLELEVLVDTGFDGFLALPADLVRDARPRGSQTFQTASDEIVTANYYSSTVRVGPFPAVEGELTALGSEAIAGRLLTDRYALLLDHGRTVTLTE